MSQESKSDEGLSSSMAGASISTAPLTCSSLPANMVNQWLDHCEKCFADKEPYPTPRSYFDTHMQKDPMLDLNGIAIVQCEEKVEETKQEEQEEDGDEGEAADASAAKSSSTASASASAAAATSSSSSSSSSSSATAVDGKKQVIAATSRVFVRQQYLNKKQITFGGIGEVCTKPAYRKQGYADLCLDRCINYGRLLQTQLLSLHAAKAFVPIYAGKGFQSIPRYFGVKSDVESETDVNIVGEGLKHGPFSLRLMPSSQFFAPTMIPQFQAMYESYSERFNGPVVRSEEYWDQWVQSDLESSVGASNRFPVEIYTAFEEWDGSDPAPKPFSPIRFLSYMFLQRVHNPLDDGDQNRDRIYQVREYASVPWWVDREDNGRQMFLSLVQYAVRQIRHKFIQMDPTAAAKAKITVKFPLPIVAGFKVPLKLDEEVLDEGFMYKPLPLSLNKEKYQELTKVIAESKTQHRGATLEKTAITSKFASSVFVLHHDSEPFTETSAGELMEELKKDAKAKTVFWNTDSY